MLTKDMLLIDAFRKEGVNVEAMADVLADFGMHCLGCPASQAESIKEACEVHGIDVEELMKQLNA